MVVTEYRMPSAGPKGNTDQPCRPNRPSPTGCLDQDEGQNNRVGTEFDPAGLKRSKNEGSDGDTGQQSDENWKHPFPYGANAAPVDEQDVEVEEDLDHDNGGIQDAICIKNQRERHRERRKPIADRAIYKGRKQGDPGKNDDSGVNGKHL